MCVKYVEVTTSLTIQWSNLLHLLFCPPVFLGVLRYFGWPYTSVPICDDVVSLHEQLLAKFDAHGDSNSVPRQCCLCSCMVHILWFNKAKSISLARSTTR